jgi:hypothetical protein
MGWVVVALLILPHVIFGILAELSPFGYEDERGFHYGVGHDT